MSETQTAPELEQKPGEPAPEQPPPEQKPEADEKPEVERRFSRLTARLNTVSRERDELAARLAQAEQAKLQQPPTPTDVQAHIRAEAQKLAAQEALNERIRTFHEKGSETYPDWEQRTSNLMAMGADPQIAELLIELPAGHKVAASLADEPEELERIAAIRTERGRAIALGQYAQRISNRPARPVSKAPKPAPVIEGRAAPVFDETTADAQTLVQFYAKQAMDQRLNRR